MNTISAQRCARHKESAASAATVVVALDWSSCIRARYPLHVCCNARNCDTSFFGLFCIASEVSLVGTFIRSSDANFHVIQYCAVLVRVCSTFTRVAIYGFMSKRTV
ncbi:hypothetical protein C7974DRAFT_136159 [Boeremia exigua]|uniref:uncharacterized protein n=1 Tax=Boeremia exigua TaxID=749465 RepID=UPI001E8CE8FB|nr:uncharacterized protein C7974DRAFT_136159 [Boeremia exigua]KAH6639647.1 hypothetical protein C7974DRAFT_136159 [Boeremia exigua]